MKNSITQALRRNTTRSFLLSLFLTGAFTLFHAGGVFAQLSGVKNIPGDYPSLSAALADLAGQGVSAGGVVFELTPSYSDAGESYPILFPSVSGSGTATIRPSASVGSPITFSSSAASTFLFDKGDRYAIDGRSGGVGSDKNIVIINTSVSGTAVTFTNDARNNSLNSVTVQGANTSATSGVVAILPGADGGNSQGNGFITISNSKIQSVNPNYAANLIYSGTSTSTLYRNNNITISNNELDNFTNSGILVDGTNQGAGPVWAITGNSVYNSALVATTSQTGINFRGGNNSNSLTLTGNFVGGRSANCGGSTWQNNGGATVIVTGIFANANSTGAANAIDNNTVQNIETLNPSSVNIIGIWAELGTRNTTRTSISNNVVGHPSVAANGLIHVGTSGLIGILTANNFAPNVNMDGNEIAYLTHNGANAGAIIRGIERRGQIASTWITNNYVHHLSATASLNTDATTGSVQTNTSVQGILFLSTFAQTGSVDNKVSGNLLHDLANTSPNDITSTVHAIIFGAANGFTLEGVAERNKVYNLISTGNTTAVRTTSGIFYASGNNWVFRNNMISLNNGGNTSPNTLIGFYDLNGGGRVLKLFNNSFFIGGTASGNSYSYGYARFLKTAVQLRNNVFYNNRTGGTANLAIANANTANNDGLATDFWPANASDFNLFVTANAASVVHWLDGSTPSPTTVAAWTTSSGCDARSWSATTATVTAGNLFVNAAAGDLSINAANAAAWYVNGKGVAGAMVENINDDFDGNSRGTTYGFGIDLGADEVTVNPVTNPAASTIRIINLGPGVYDFFFANRKVASANVVTQGTLSSLTLRYFTGVNPQNPVGGSQYFNAYWKLDANVGASGYEVEPTFFYDEHLLGGVTTESDATLRFTRTGLCSSWQMVPTTPNVALNQAAVALQTTLGEYTGTVTTAPLDDFSPTSLNAVVNGNFVDVSWVQTGATEYDVQYSSNVNFPADLTGATTVTVPSTTTTLVLGPATYKWRVRSVCNGDAGDYVNGSDFTVTQPLPGCFDPANLSAVQQASPNENNINISFTHPLPSSVSNYTIQYSANPGFPSVTNGAVTVVTPATSTTLLSVPTGYYKWRLRANCSNGQNSAWIEGPNFTAGTPAPCDAPSGLTAVQGINGSNFSWNTVGGASNYTFEFSSNPAFPSDMTGATSLTLLNPTYTNTTLAPATYKWRVRSNCGVVSSAFTNGTDFTVIPNPGCQTPTPISAVQQGSPNEDKVVFTFSHPNPTFVNSYTIRYSANLSFPSVTNGAVTTVVTGSPATLTVPPGDYKWDVRANCSGSSAYVQGPTFTVTGANPSCGNPTGVAAVQQASPNNYNVTFNWNAVAGASNYTLQYSANPAFPADQTDAVTVTQTGTSRAVSFAATGTIRWRVRANCPSSQYSLFVNGANVNITDTPPVCTAPTPVAAVWYPSVNQVRFSWTPPSGSTVSNYTLQYGIGNYNSSVTISGIASHRYVALSVNGNYQWRIRSNCADGTQSSFANGPNFDVVVAREGKAVAELEEANFTASAYPNPVSDRLNVDFVTESETPAAIRMYDYNGREVFANTLTPTLGLNRLEINVAEMAKGVYMVRVSQGENNQNLRVVVK